jgi:hypothetical protein
MPESEQEAQSGIELTRQNLDSPGAAVTLATVAIASLKEYGCVTFVMHPNGEVVFANPAYVDIQPQAVQDLGDKPIRFVRPLLGDGKPRFVGWKDGRLWEVEVAL